jgi:hypothetical protein
MAGGPATDTTESDARALTEAWSGTEERGCHLMRKLCAGLLAAALGAAGCVETKKSENPLSPTVAGPIPGVAITAPTPLEPAQGARIAVEQQPITLMLENSSTSGVRPLTYAFEVASDSSFANLVFVREGIVPGDGGRTALRLPDPLASGRTYYWRAKAEDGANTGPYSFTVLFNVFTPIVIGRPTALAPSGAVTQLSPRFSIGNAPRSGPVGPITYWIELATNESFTAKAAIWTVAEQPSQTNLDTPGGLLPGTQYFWRTAASDPTTTGPWSDILTFRTPAPTVPTGGGQPCGPPYPTTPFGIVQCRRSQWGAHLPHDQIIVFLRGVANDLNAANIAGGPFGILRKTSGANCGGFSCDIICSGQGNSQRQWDVLGDVEGAATPAWIGPRTVPDIRVDLCQAP